MAGTGVETKVAAGSAVGIVSGVVAWLLVTNIPAWRAGIPAELAPFIPIAVAWLLSTGAAYFAPHTHRPDLAPAAANPLAPPSTTVRDHP